MVSGGPYNTVASLPIAHALTSKDVDRIADKFDELRKAIIEFIGSELDAALAAQLASMDVPPEALPLQLSPANMN